MIRLTLEIAAATAAAILHHCDQCCVRRRRSLSCAFGPPQNASLTGAASPYPG